MLLLVQIITKWHCLCLLQLALYVLSFLEPRDLLRAAQTCRCWRILAEDNLLWREKCREAGIDEVREVLGKRRAKSLNVVPSPWKSAYMRQQNIEMNWRCRDIRIPKVRIILYVNFANRLKIPKQSLFAGSERPRRPRDNLPAVLGKQDRQWI